MKSAKKIVLTSSETTTLAQAPSSSETISVPQMPPRVMGPTRTLPTR